MTLKEAKDIFEALCEGKSLQYQVFTPKGVKWVDIEAPSVQELARDYLANNIVVRAKPAPVKWRICLKCRLGFYDDPSPDDEHSPSESYCCGSLSKKHTFVGLIQVEDTDYR